MDRATDLFDSLPGLMGVVYVYLIAFNIGKAEGSFNSLAGVASLFKTPELLLADWVHSLNSVIGILLLLRRVDRVKSLGEKRPVSRLSNWAGE
jgi:hypothetical protein